VREYRRRGAGTGVGIWAVLAGGFTTMVVILALLLAGAAIAGTSTLLLLTCAVAVLAAGAAGLDAAPRRALAVSRRLSRHPRRSPTIARLAAAVAGLSRQPTGAGWAAGVLACIAAGLAADAGVLTACFGLAGLPVPWRGLLFAYAAGQLGGRLVPLPGGLGGVEGGVLGALTLSGISPAVAAAAVIAYRVAGYWTVGAAGTTVAAALTRRPSAKPPGPCHDYGRGASVIKQCPPGEVSVSPGGTVLPRSHYPGPPRNVPPQVHPRVKPFRQSRSYRAGWRHVTPTCRKR
jgi:uncharacterized membrane protein YbhN (UPF0104 family)